MSAGSDFGSGVLKVDEGVDVVHALAAEDAPRHGSQSPGEWMKANLFSRWYNGVFSIVFGLIGIVLFYFAARFVFVTAQWIPVRANLELFMIGQFSRSERTRIVVELLILSGAIGILVGWMRQRARAEADLAGLEFEPTRPREIVGSYWAIAAFIGFCMIVGVRTAGPWLLLVACLVAGAAGYLATLRTRSGPVGIALRIVPLVPLAIAGGVLSQVQDLNNQASYLIAGAAVVTLAVVQYLRRPAVTLSVGLVVAAASFQVLSGTHGLAWIYMTLACLPALVDTIGRYEDRLGSVAGWIGSGVALAGLVVLFVVTGGEFVFQGLEFDGAFSIISSPLGSAAAFLGGVGLVVLLAAAFVASAISAAARHEPGPALQLGGFAVLGVAFWLFGRIVDVQGLEWDSWGLHTNLIVATASIILAFPIGVLLALGRRSTLPVLRMLSTVYIEIIRGVPLISLLFIAFLFLSFFFPEPSTLPLVTRATIVITMFSAAYIAEIVRGGLQSVEKGQTEAGQAMGMSPGAITRLLVLPQALKNVIPALVGQFISLFKDTSLLFFITVLEFLGVRDIVHAQAEFRGLGIAETLVFVAFGFWAFSFTMSRESQRLERRLDTGNR
ncbi:MAG: amino acid ABC transporter permease [Ilumatobacter sp.]|uniref:amino acid ABC transporter permease n=1 Tax=Ilumatobacter sp. TaxID=1967498 RepID=UPI003C730DCC